MKQVIENYTFNDSAKTVTLTDFSVSDPVSLNRLYLITDVTKNVIIYNFADSTVATAAVSSGNVITLSTLPAGLADTDSLQVIYETATSDPVYEETVVDTVAAGAVQSPSVITSGGTATAAGAGRVVSVLAFANGGDGTITFHGGTMDGLIYTVRSDAWLTWNPGTKQTATTSIVFSGTLDGIVEWV